MFKKTAPIFALLVAITMTSSAFAQDRYSLTLSNEFISKLKEFGSLKSEVSASARDKIGVIELRFADTKDETPVELDIDVNIAGSDAAIILDEDLIAKIKGQPVRIPTDKNGFSRVLLKYDSPALSTESAMVMSDNTVFVRLSDVKSIAGELDGLDSITMACKFGEVTIPLDQIAGIQMHVDEKNSAVIVLNDGDALTGVPEIPMLTLITDWGKAEVEPESIQSITTTANSKFSRKNTDFGTRWELKTGNSFAPGM
jgi:hypothetical protein